jgi:hypothetical protein
MQARGGNNMQLEDARTLQLSSGGEVWIVGRGDIQEPKILVGKLGSCQKRQSTGRGEKLDRCGRVNRSAIRSEYRTGANQVVGKFVIVAHVTLHGLDLVRKTQRPAVTT